MKINWQLAIKAIEKIDNRQIAFSLKKSKIVNHKS
jgi:hypothetical protein